MNDIQKSLNPLIDELIPIEVFVKAGTVAKLVKNTFGVKCPKCGSEDVNEQEIQTRSADEAATKIFTCLQCSNKWRKG